MLRTGSLLGPLLTALMFAWVLGIFWIPTAVWLDPWVHGEPRSLIGSNTTGSDAEAVVVPARQSSRPGRKRLADMPLDRSREHLLRLRVGASRGLTLQVQRSHDRTVLDNLRIPPTETTADHLMVLTGYEAEGAIRLTLWNRAPDVVQVETATVQPLSALWRWGRRGYRLLGPVLLVIALWLVRDVVAEYLRTDPGPSQSRNVGRGDRLAAGLLLGLCFLVYRAAPVHQLLDAKFTSVVSHAVLTSGSTALPEDFVATRRVEQSYTLRWVGDDVEHFFSAAPAVLSVPFVAAFERAGISPVSTDGRYLGHNELRILRFVAAFLTAATCAVLFLTARIWLGPPASLGLALVFAFGTQLFSTVSRPFWSHAWAILLLALALYLLTTPQLRDRRVPYVAIATLLSWSYFCRPPMSLAIIAVTILLWLARPRTLVPFLATGAVWMALFGWYSLQTFSSLLPPYFLSSHLESGRLGGAVFTSRYAEALVGTLLSPGRGLLIYVPMVLVLVIVLVGYRRWLPDRQLVLIATGVCLAHWQLVCLFRNWWGGQSFGPRLLSDMLPWLFILAVQAWAALRDAGRAGAYRWTRFKAVTVALLVSASIVIHLRGAWVQETQHGAGIWNWRYPQFLAGMVPRPDSDAHAEDD